MFNSQYQFLVITNLTGVQSLAVQLLTFHRTHCPRSQNWFLQISILSTMGTQWQNGFTKSRAVRRLLFWFTGNTNPWVMNVSRLQIFGTYVKKTLTALTLPCRLFSGHRRWPFLQQHPLRLPVSWVQFPASVDSALTTEIWYKHGCTLNPFSRRCFTCSYSVPCFALSFPFLYKLLKSYLLHCFIFFLRYKH